MPSILTRPSGGGGAGGGSISVAAYSDAGFTNPITSADLGDTIYLKATVSGITPTIYRFDFQDENGGVTVIYEGANDNVAWLIPLSTVFGNGQLFAWATDDGVNWISVEIDFELEGAFYLDLTSVVPKYSVSVTRYLKQSFVGNYVVLIRRTDNTQRAFTPTEIIDGTLLAWVGGGNGFVVTLYDQSGNGNNRTMSVASEQFYLVIAGVLQVDSNGKPKMVTQSLGGVAPFGNTAFALSSSSGSFTMVSSKFRGNSYGTRWATLRNGNNTNLAIDGYALLGWDVGSGTANTLVGSPRLFKNNIDLGTTYTGGEVYAFLGNSESVVELTGINFATSTTWLTNFSEFVSVNEGEISEFTLWDDDISADRIALNVNAQTFYNY